MDSGLVALIVIILVRFFVPLTLFRFPLLGALFCIIGDISDVMIFEEFGAGPLTGGLYHNFDKVFDIWYLFFELLVARRWANNLAKNTAVFFFMWRFLGFVTFEASTILGATFRPAFTLSPNIFEHWYIAWTVIKKWNPRFVLTKTRLAIILFIVGAPKLIQEYIMHFAYPDQTWNFLRDHLFWWVYE